MPVRKMARAPTSSKRQVKNTSVHSRMGVSSKANGYILTAHTSKAASKTISQKERVHGISPMEMLSRESTLRLSAQMCQVIRSNWLGRQVKIKRKKSKHPKKKLKHPKRRLNQLNLKLQQKRSKKKHSLLQKKWRQRNPPPKKQLPPVIEHQREQQVWRLEYSGKCPTCHS